MNNDRLDSIRRSPRQADVTDVEDLCSEIDRLRTVMDDASAHLGAARAQRAPSDDKIIADHIDAAYAVLVRGHQRQIPEHWQNEIGRLRAALQRIADLYPEEARSSAGLIAREVLAGRPQPSC